MVLKEIDSKENEIKELESLFFSVENKKLKKMIFSDLKKIKNGYENEKDNGYYLNFLLKDTNESIILNDIRLESQGRVAQIDHLIIYKNEILILESKSFSGKVTIKTDKSLQVLYRNRTYAYPNPLEQAKRHKKVLETFLKDNNMLKNSLFNKTEINAVVIFNPETLITNEQMPKDFYRSDSVLELRKSKNYISNLLKKKNNIYQIADLILKNHKPIKYNYKKKYNSNQLQTNLMDFIPEHKEKKIDKHVQSSMENIFNEKIVSIEDAKKDNPYKFSRQGSFAKEGDLCPRCKKANLILIKNKDKEFLRCLRYPKCRKTIFY